MATARDKTSTAAKYLPIFGASLVLGLAFDYLFYSQMPGLSFPVYVALIAAAFFALAARFQSMPDKSIYWLLGPLLFFAFMVFVRAAQFLTFLNICAVLFLLVLIADFIVGLKLRDYFIVDYVRSCFLVPFNALDKFFVALGDIPAVLGQVKDRDRSAQIVRGIVLTVPILLLLVVLFSSADMVFHKYASKIIDIQISAETVLRTFLVLSATAAFIGVFTYFFIKPARTGYSDRPVGDRRGLGVIEGSIILGSVNALFLGFILIQVTYLFGGKRNIALPGVTYAQYARRGFFELIAVAAFAFLLLWLTDKFIVRRETGHTMNFKLLGPALVLQVLVVMASALKRLALYEGAYGFTSLRFYSHAFIFWLAIIFLLLLIKIFTAAEEDSLALRALVASLVFLAALNAFNPDAFIARQNIARYQRTGKLDAWYLGRLSSDALPETIKILDLKDQDLSRDFAASSYWKWEGGRQWIDRWQSSNLARNAGHRLLDNRSAYLKQNKERQPPNYPEKM